MLDKLNLYKNMIAWGIILIVFTGIGTYAYFTYRSLTNQIAQYVLNEDVFSNVIIGLNVELNNAESNAARLRNAVNDKTVKESEVDAALKELKAENAALRNAPPTIIYKNEIIRNIVTGTTDTTVSDMLHNISRLTYADF